MSFSSSTPMVHPTTDGGRITTSKFPTSNKLQVPRSLSPSPADVCFDGMSYSPLPNTPPDAPFFHSASPPPSPFGLAFPSANSPHVNSRLSPQEEAFHPPIKSLGGYRASGLTPPPESLLHPRAGEKRQKKKTSNRMTKTTTSFSAASHFCESSPSAPSSPLNVSTNDNMEDVLPSSVAM